jgi:hypothetical protein
MIGSGETGKRKKRVKREPQWQPLIVSAARTRVTMEVAMSAPMSRELRRYIKWAAKEARLTEDEAMVLTLDRAIGDLLRRDELWQAHEPGDGVQPHETTASPATPPPVPVPGKPTTNGAPGKQP